MPVQGLTLGHQSGEVVHGTETLHLAATSFRLLEVLAQEPGQVVTMSELCKTLHGRTVRGAEDEVRRHMRHIRRQLNRRGCRHIVTVYGVGYAFFSDCLRPT